jgi:thiamine biosynthesis lipoprotein
VTAPEISVGPIAVEERPGGLFAAAFTAMASPCELLVYASNRTEALELGGLAAHEAWRIEHKYSRYRDDSLLASIHRQRGERTAVDTETASLLDFAQQCYEMSAGLFDITSGILRYAWRFDGSDRLADPATVERLLPLVGFTKLQWHSPTLLVPAGMELDFGGLGKEYAVDRAYDLVAARTSQPFLVNFGGDLRANRRPMHAPWQVGIERPDSPATAATLLELDHGALATSGDSHRYLLKDGVRYSHILDPRTGWPVAHAPRSITVAASSCTEAGLLATLAMLQGADAAAFLQEQGVRHWVLR